MKTYICPDCDEPQDDVLLHPDYFLDGKEEGRRYCPGCQADLDDRLFENEEPSFWERIWPW